MFQYLAIDCNLPLLTTFPTLLQEIILKTFSIFSTTSFYVDSFHRLCSFKRSKWILCWFINSYKSAMGKCAITITSLFLIVLIVCPFVNYWNSITALMSKKSSFAGPFTVCFLFWLLYLWCNDDSFNIGGVVDNVSCSSSSLSKAILGSPRPIVHGSCLDGNKKYTFLS